MTVVAIVKKTSVYKVSLMIATTIIKETSIYKPKTRYLKLILFYKLKFP